MKHMSFLDYSPKLTEYCERILITLLHRIGPWRSSVYLAGGLVPRYLIDKEPGLVGYHAGTDDVDVVLDLSILAEIEAHNTFEENLASIGFNRAIAHTGEESHWRWTIGVSDGELIRLEFLTEVAGSEKFEAHSLPAGGNLAAAHVPHIGMVFDHHEETEVTAELLFDGGMATETVRYADIVSFTCLKAWAFDSRGERKDAHDIVYCLENYDGGIEGVCKSFERALTGKHEVPVRDAIRKLARRFCSLDDTEGYLKDGPTSVAYFEVEDNRDADAMLKRQSQISDLVEAVVKPFL